MRYAISFMMETIYGLLDKITYWNEANDFVVARLQEQDKKGITTIVGNLAGIHPGESLKLTGKWVVNKKFGEQFLVEKFEVVSPATILGIRKYLGSGLIRGIGPVMADRIVDRFGLETLEIIEKYPGKLSDVEGIGPKRISMINQAWEEHREVKEIMIFLQSYGVSSTYSAKIFKRYGSRSIEIVKENPYRLIRDIPGIGFLTADRIAQHLGIDYNSVIRARAGLIHVLNECVAGGHVYYPEKDLTHKARELLRIDPAIIVQAVKELSQEKEIVIEPAVSEPGERAVYLAPFFVAETGTGQALKRLREAPSGIRPIHPEKAIDWIQQKLGIKLAVKQKEAILAAATSKVLIITGGPGTGKTTLIQAILKIFQQLKLKIFLAAPTGRAAKRMAEATGWEAKTIHRLLEYTPQRGDFKKNQSDPLEAEVVIIDETSMVDVLLMYHMLKAIPAQAHLILVGDVDQLPSVGPGNVLKDLIDSNVFKVVRLTDIFRQAQESLIVINAHRVNQGESPLLPPYPLGREALSYIPSTVLTPPPSSHPHPNPPLPKGPSNGEGEGEVKLAFMPPKGGGQSLPRTRYGGEDKPSDFYFIEEENPEKILHRVIELCGEDIPKRFGFHSLRDIQVLTPMHKGIIGTINLNMELQKALNPHPPGFIHGGKTFKLGDKVMQVVNNYTKEVFNGDIAWISKIDQENREIVIDFEGKSVPYESSELDEVVLAYAASVHKSQGSEYPAVVLIVSTQHYLLLQRNLIYTGLTRARKLAVVIGTKKALSIAIQNNKPHMRFTRLAERLCRESHSA
jgi:exodeoxyribonuclease V alpha subunit